MGAACRLLGYYKLAGFVLRPETCAAQPEAVQMGSSTDLGLLRLTATWITGSSMYGGLLVRISTGGLLKCVLVAVGLCH